MKNPEITKVLTRHSVPISRVIDTEHFSLLEREIPALCADRVDYALREFAYWLNPRIVQMCFHALKNVRGEIVFFSPRAASLFAGHFLKLQSVHWGGVEAMKRYFLFSRLLKDALRKEIICKRDFYHTEKEILHKIEYCRERSIQEILAILRKKQLPASAGPYFLGKKIVKKFRYVDPKILQNGALVRLSQMSPRFKSLCERHRKVNAKGLMV